MAACCRAAVLLLLFFASAHSLSHHGFGRERCASRARCGCIRATVEIRECAPADIMPVSNLLLRTFSAGLNPVQSSLIVAEHAVGLRERMQDNVMLVSTAEGGAVCGFVEVYTPEYLVSQVGQEYPERVRKALKPYVSSLAVDASSRGAGVGAALMRAVEARPELSARVLSLEVEDSNAAAIGLYSKLGYTLTGRDEKARKLVGDIFFGRSETVTKLWYEKSLGDRAAAGAEQQLGAQPRSDQRASWLNP